MKLQLKRLRKAAGFKTQKEFAQLLGVPERTYGSWEREEVAMSLPQVVACAEILDCTLDEIAGRTITRTYTDKGQEIVNICYESMNDKGKETLVSVAQSMQRDTANRLVKNQPEGVADDACEGVA